MKLFLRNSYPAYIKRKVIFKNKYYGNSTFTIDKNELEVKDLKYGQNRRSSEQNNFETNL